MNDNKIGFKTPHTVEGRVFEVATAVLLLALWLLSIWAIRHAGADVATVVSQSLIATILAPVMLLLCYAPKTFNIPVRNPRAEHYLLIIRLIRIITILTVLMFCATVVIIIQPRLVWLTFVFTGLIAITIAWFLWKTLRLK
ncbi:MAG: hypothetical protein IJ710_00970 [Prevotella sp.]|nr:hypothetical protein [Prevotella sp.]